MPGLLRMAISLVACLPCLPTGRRPAGGVEHVGRAAHNSSVFLNGRPRSPLKSLRRRRSLELDGRRMISGATLLPVSRRARLPLSQSSQLIGSFIGIVGTPDLESLGLFMHQ